MFFTLVHAFVFSVLTQASQPAEPRRVKPGDTPPPLKVAAWIPNQPKVLPGGAQTEGDEKFFVVHFWSPSDAGSRQCLPYLVHLHEQFSKHGLLIIGLSNEDSESLAHTHQSMGLPYAVAADDENACTESWLAEVQDFPYTFLLDRTGRVVWSGNSMGGLREAVAAVAAGTLNVEHVRKVQEIEKKIEPMTAALRDQLAGEDEKGVRRTLEKIISVDGSRIESWRLKHKLMHHLGRGRGDAALYDEMREALWNSVAGLDEIVTSQWGEKLAERDPELMLRCAERMVELTKREDPFALICLARVQHELGKHRGAIESQARAVELLTLDAEGEFAATLDYYKRITLAAEKKPAATASAPASRRRDEFE